MNKAEKEKIVLKKKIPKGTIIREIHMFGDNYYLVVDNAGYFMEIKNPKQ